mmetsp:Transcript_117926/g.328544  ORF Transcript_117926/g.328544 Transcript_117926/m.328544 type:complete len:203 (-) Transcript_117926:1401-2009(-)
MTWRGTGGSLRRATICKSWACSCSGWVGTRSMLDPLLPWTHLGASLQEWWLGTPPWPRQEVASVRTSTVSPSGRSWTSPPYATGRWAVSWPSPRAATSRRRTSPSSSASPRDSWCTRCPVACGRGLGWTTPWMPSRCIVCAGSGASLPSPSAGRTAAVLPRRWALTGVSSFASALRTTPRRSSSRRRHGALSSSSCGRHSRL